MCIRMTSDPPKTIGSLLARIERGEVRAHSRTRFLAVTVLLTIAFAAALFGAVFLVSFAIFLLRISGAIVLPEFGVHGFRLLLSVMPWILVAIACMLAIAAAALARRVPAVYHRPVVLSTAAVFTLLTLLAVAVDHTPLHAALREQQRPLPILGSLYRMHRVDRLHVVRTGTVSEIGEAAFALTAPEGTVVVRTTEATRLPNDRLIAVGDRVIAIGEETPDGFLAYGIRPADVRWRDGYRRRGPGTHRPMPW